MKEENNKEQVRKNIVEAAMELFSQRGIKDVKMDDIASRISVSKRTIYEQFGDKEQLITEALKYNNTKLTTEAKELIRNATDTLDIILKLYHHYFKILRGTNIKFFTDIEKYPEIHNVRKARQEKDNRRFIAWMEEGRKEGLFREDADFKILSFILGRDFELIMTVNKQPDNSDLGRYSPEELGERLILFYLRGIATPKGQEKIEQFIRKEKEKTITK